jgi:chorismate mutase-like protein
MGQPNGKSEKTLEDWRQEIDTLDAELLRLLNRRATIACEIAAIKVASGLPAYDAKRESQVLERIAARNSGPFDSESVAAVFRSIIQETRRLGTERMEGFSETPVGAGKKIQARGSGSQQKAKS